MTAPGATPPGFRSPAVVPRNPRTGRPLHKLPDGRWFDPVDDALYTELPSEAIKLLYMQTVAALRGFVRRRVPDDRVDDVVQETFLRVLTGRLDRLVAVESFTAYLFGIAKNVIRDELRSSSYQELLAGSAQDLEPADVAGVEDIGAGVIDQVALDRVLASLPDETREIALLSADGYPVREIAQLVGLPVSRVTVHLQVLRHELYKLNSPSPKSTDGAGWWQEPDREWGASPEPVLGPTPAPRSIDERIDAAIARLPERQCEVMSRKVHEGMKPRHIALELGITPNDARVNLWHGHAALARALNVTREELKVLLRMRATATQRAA
jgi:RNA polymerase sigma-70 factor (ECF subfamily)